MNEIIDGKLGDTSDAELLKRFKDGDRDVAVEIYTRYANRLLNLTAKQSGPQLTTRVDADDIVQSVFRTFFRRANEGYYHLPDGDELWKLFLVISLNKIRKKSHYHHAFKRDVSRTESLANKQLPASETPEALLRFTIDELICKLPAEQQGVIRDRIEGYEIGEISVRNKLSRRTTERILQSFRNRLERELESD